jgi:hypothetical protein
MKRVTLSVFITSTIFASFLMLGLRDNIDAAESAPRQTWAQYRTSKLQSLQKVSVQISSGGLALLKLGFLDQVKSPGICEVMNPTTIDDTGKSDIYSTFIPTAPSHPFFVEYCFSGNYLEKPRGEKSRWFSTVRNLKKKLKGANTHGLLYVQGLAIDTQGNDRPDYIQKLKLADPVSPGETPQGLGISTNFNTRNAFVATPGGRHVVFYGGLKRPEVFTKDKKDQLINELADKGYQRGVFQKKCMTPLYRSGPRVGEGIERSDPEYDRVAMRFEFGWAWGVALSRPVYCSRIPLAASELNELKDYLNAINQEGVASPEGHYFNVFTNNCSHPGVNMLAHLGILNPIKMSSKDQQGRVSHPASVPMDIFTVANHTSLRIKDVYRNPKSRQKILEKHQLPTRPGTVLNFTPVHPENDVYQPKEDFNWFPTTHHRTGPFQGIGAQLFTNKPYYNLLKTKEATDLKANLEFHLQKIQAAREEIRQYQIKSRLKARSPSKSSSQNFQDFLKVYDNVLEKSEGEVVAWILDV